MYSGSTSGAVEVCSYGPNSGYSGFGWLAVFPFELLAQATLEGSCDAKNISKVDIDTAGLKWSVDQKVNIFK